MSNKSRFYAEDYAEAKEYLKDAVILKQYKSNVEINTTYRTVDGYMFFEHESLLEGRDSEYCLQVMQEPL